MSTINANHTITLPTAGFGEYDGVSTDLSEYQSAQKTHALIVAALLGVSAVGCVIATVAFPIMVWAAPVAIIGTAVVGVRTYLNYRASQNAFPSSLTEGLRPQDFHAKPVGEWSRQNENGLVLSDAVESKKYKLDFIRSAESSIFLSCYMGEEAFDEALDLIKERLVQKRELKVFIFGSDHFLTAENHRRLNFLKETYADRFFSVLNPEIYASGHPQNGKILLSTNHIKLTAIDQGAYAIIGGCALRPFWTDVKGTEHLAKLTPTFDFFYNPLEAKGFRDMDFVLKSQASGSGTTAFLEGAKLMLRYAHLQDPAFAEKIKKAFLEVMRRPAPATQIPSVDGREDLAQNVGVKLFSTGPDHLGNTYSRSLIDMITAARNKIVIAHMYFHPPQEIIDALKQAAKRGVKIEIVTNSKDDEAPLAHRFFVDLAQTKYRQLLIAEGSENVKVHAFYRANTTYHKKVIVIDDRYTAFGSSNFGKKSLEENPDDYEFNGIVDSQPFAAETMRVIGKDIELSRTVSPEQGKNLSWDTWLLSFFQEWVMTKIL